MTILFADDWRYYPTAIADFTTQNKSFLRLAQLYDSMGIKNNVFHLALLNPTLQKLDPYDPGLTYQQKMDISAEARQNPWYFFREVVRLPPMAGTAPVPLRANRGNIGLFWSFFNHIDVALIQPRQTGKSVSTDCLMTNLLFFSTDNTNIQNLTKGADLRQKQIDRLKKIRDLLPKYMLEISRDDADNQVEITYKARKNSYNSAVGQPVESSALNVGRGFTTPILQSDEGPFTPNIQLILPAALAAGTAARREARENGRPYGNVFTTTAGKKDTKEGKYMYDLIFGGATWDERLVFDSHNEANLRERVIANCPGAPGHESKKKKGQRALVNITLSHKQLGETDEWLEEAISNAGGTPDSIDRDFFNRWTSGSLRSPLSTELMERIAASMKQVKHLEFSKENYCLNWFIEEGEIAQRMATSKVVAGLDTSEAVGRDGIALVLVDVETLEVLAVGTYNETNLIQMAHYFGNLLIRYKNITLIPERKSSGLMIVDYLVLQLVQAGEDPFRRIFNRIVDEADSAPEAYQELNRPIQMRNETFYNTRKGMFGFNTNSGLRTTLYTIVLQNAAKNSAGHVHSERLIQELASLVVKNDRIDHANSGHDDHVIAWLLTHWLLSHGRNLSHYGIDYTRVMSAISRFSATELDPKQAYQQREQNRLLEEAGHLLESLEIERDAWVIAKLEGRLRSLSGRLVSEGENSYVQTIDAAINQSRESREKMRMLGSRNGQSNGNYRGMEQVNRNVMLGGGFPQHGNRITYY